MDRGRCMFLALCHDMAESYVGDVPTYAGVPKGQCVSPVRSRCTN